MIVEFLQFFNETELLKRRLTYLWNKVDYFIITESDKGYSGLPKDYNFIKHRDQFESYSSKIIYNPIIGLSGENAWSNEEYQRNACEKFIGLFSDDDILLFSDADEIPLRASIDYAIECMKEGTEVIDFKQRLFYNSINYETGHTWYGTRAVKKSFFKNNRPIHARNVAENFIEPGGFHFSYFFMDAALVKYKIESFSHQEYNNSFWTSKEKVEERRREGRDPFDRSMMFAPEPGSIDPEILVLFSEENEKKSS